MQYYINTQTNKITKGDNLGASFRKPPYREATQEEINSYELGELKASKISTCKAYLASKDWLAAREVTEPNSFPQAVKDLVIEARTAINDLEDLTTLEQVEAYDITKFES